MSEKSLRFVIYLLSFLFIFSLFVFYALAWQEPTQTPPGQNAYAPINVGPNLQIKTGPLQFSSYYGLDNAYFVNPSGTVSALFKGKVGIRTLNPNYPLDVFGDINISSGLLRIEGNEGSPGQVLTRTATGLAWQTPTGNVSFPLLAPLGSATNPSYSFSGDTNTGIFSAGADILSFTTGGTERMRINSSGNVGIGTT
jgi:hypothetical protein